MQRDLFDEYMDTCFRSTEGESGTRNLEQLCEVLGYGQGFMRGRAIEDFLQDNPGAIQAVVDFVESRINMFDWKQRLNEYLVEGE